MSEEKSSRSKHYQVLDYRALTPISVDVHHTLDLLYIKQKKKNIKKGQGDGFLPKESIGIAQLLQNAGFLIFLNVSEHEGQKDQREKVREKLAEGLYYGKSNRFTTGKCLRPVTQFLGLACIQCTRQTWKPAVCLAYGAPVHIDDKYEICEKCERAGIVPIHIRCEIERDEG